MGSKPGTTNNPNHGKNLTHFDSERAKAAAKKSAEVRQRNKAEKAAAEAAAKRDIVAWTQTYQREQLGDACAAAAQKIAHDILSGAINDQRALIAALPTLVDIARIEAGQHTSATLHATITSTDPMERIRQLRAQASQPASATLVSGQGDTEPPSVEVSSTEAHPPNQNETAPPVG